jgi:hypothetical protein
LGFQQIISFYGSPALLSAPKTSALFALSGGSETASGYDVAEINAREAMALLQRACRKTSSDINARA